MPNPLAIHYLELPARDIGALKRFYADLLGWTFTDYGPTYAAFAPAGGPQAGLEGGLQADLAEAPAAPLPVVHAPDLDAFAARVVAAGGAVTRPAFAFPGGRRLHFRDPSGNELAAAAYD